MSTRVDELERLQRLRDSGALTQEEFEAEKGRILGGVAAPAEATAEEEALDQERRSRLWLYVILALIGILIAVGIGLLVGREVAPRREAEAQGNGIAGNVAEPSLDAAAPPPVNVETLPPAEQLDRAFQAAFGKSGSVVVALDSGKDYGTESFQENVQFTPGALVPAPFGPVLLSIGEVQDAAHVSAGKIAAHYLRAAGDRFEVVRSFVPAVVTGSFGHVDSWSVSRKFSDYPVIYTTGGGTWQGYSCSSATLTELAPDGPHELATVPLSYSNGGAVTDGSGATTINGRIANVVKGQAFDVVYTGSDSFVEHYVRTATGYALQGDKTRMQTC